jgi:CRISPR-associated protein Cas5h
MEALKFDLLGRYAFFKNPESNMGTEFSFEHIHKPALLGVLGGILGMNGRQYVTKDNVKLDYYEELKNIKVSIAPKHPIFNKFTETITNTTGYANIGNTQILDREILQNVQWTIYILKDSINEVYWNELVLLLKNHESKYPIFLGNNSYKARVDKFELVNLNTLEKFEDVTISSIYREGISEISECVEDEDITPYKLSTHSPNDLDNLLMYKHGWFIFSNLISNVTSDKDSFLKHKDCILYFM